MNEYFPKQKYLEANAKIELDLSNYDKKADLNNATGVDTSDFSKKANLANLKSDVDKLHVDKLKNVPCGPCNLKSKVDKLDIGKLETIPVNLSEVSDVVKHEVVKKTEYNELLIKVNNINTTSDLVKKLTTTQKLKITDHNYDKYITTQEFNKLTSENFAARLAQANLASKTDITDFVKKTDFDDKLKKLN